MSENNSAQLCRLCLADGEEMISISENIRGILLREIIQQLLLVEVTKTNGQYWSICKQCFDKVKLFKLFQLSCVHSINLYPQVMANRPIGCKASETTSGDSSIVEVMQIKQEAETENDVNIFYAFHAAIPQDDPIPNSLPGMDVPLVSNDADSDVPTTSECQPSDSHCCQPVDNAEESSNDDMDHSEDFGDHVGTFIKQEVSELYDPLNYCQAEILQTSLPVEPQSRLRDNHLSGGCAVGSSEDVLPNWKVTLKRISGGDPTSSSAIPDVEKNTMEANSTAQNSLTFGERNLISKGDNDKTLQASLSFECGLCDEKFATNIEKLTHKRTHVSRKCDKCGQKFANMRSLEKHRKLHIPSSKTSQTSISFACGLCDEKFATRMERQIHKRTHVSLKCDKCGKKCATLGTLQVHRKNHLHSLDYKCEVCGKCFHWKRSYKNHLLIHSEKKPYSCEICSKEFCQKRVYKDHMKIHSSEQLYKCELCSREYYTKPKLDRHLKDQFLSEPQKCQKCGKEFTHKCGIRMHYLTHQLE